MTGEGYDIYFPNLHLGIRHLVNSVSPFGFRIAFYGMIIGVGMLLGILAANRDYIRHQGKGEDLQDFALVTLVLAILGARLYYVLFQWSYYSAHPAEILNIRQGGLAIYGGVLMALLCMYLFTKKIRKISFWKLGDSAVIGLILGQAIGRWGNFFNAEAFGRPFTGFLSMRLKESIINPNMLDAEVRKAAFSYQGIRYIQVHPTFLYESCWNLLGFLLLNLLSRKKLPTGTVFLSYFCWYGLGRFWIEGLRTDSLMLFGSGIRVSQALSLLLLSGAAVLLCRRSLLWRGKETTA